MHSNHYHLSVLADETISALNIQPAGVYVDATYGGGGHSARILSALGVRGTLVAFDQDSDAQANLQGDKRLIFVHNNFRYMGRFLRLHGIEKVHGILADLGVSSHQFDDTARGFSLRDDSVQLDMRMNQAQARSAQDLLASYDEKQLAEIFARYADLHNAEKVARAVVEYRKTWAIQNVGQLKNAIKNCVVGNPISYYARVFQALRIALNEEMESLAELLAQSTQYLAKGGRLCVISFHSVEDRVVKNFIREGVQADTFRAVYKKPVVASDKEVRENVRSRSAKLRVAEKL